MTKEQERAALEKIKRIVAELGEDSYVAAAFEGCFEIASENIEYDFACSMRQSLERAIKRLDEAMNMAATYKKERDEFQNECERLRVQLDREQEWQAYEDKENVSQISYEKLLRGPGVKLLTDERARDLLYERFGFVKERITIVKNVPVYEINRHRCFRKVGYCIRNPAYISGDWNYIRFDCAGVSYELNNGDLQLFC
jgi:hypothetical protein